MFIRFLVAHGSSAFSIGVHSVILAWLSVGVLQLNAAQLGWIQAASLIPNLIFMLIAGVYSDRYNPSRIMSLALVVHALAFCFLLFLLIKQSLNFEYLMLYGVIVGVGNAFIQPAREKIISSLRQLHVQKRFSYASIIQFSLQSIGIALASVAEWVSYEVIVVIQIATVLVAAVSIYSLSLGWQKADDIPSSGTGVERAIRGSDIHVWQSALLGMNYVFKHRVLLQLMGLIGFNGYMHLGVFLVMLPYMAKFVYAFTAVEYGLLQLVFVVGMVAAHFNIARKETLQNPGQGALFSLLYTALIGYALAKVPTISGFYFIVFCWGAVAGNSAARCRLVVQSVSNVELKGRVMSIYQLVLFGCAPLGALVTGYVIQLLHYKQILWVMSITSIVMFGVLMFKGALWTVEQKSEKNDAD